MTSTPARLATEPSGEKEGPLVFLNNKDGDMLFDTWQLDKIQLRFLKRFHNGQVPPGSRKS